MPWPVKGHKFFFQYCFYETKVKINSSILPKKFLLIEIKIGWIVI